MTPKAATIANVHAQGKAVSSFYLDVDCQGLCLPPIQEPKVASTSFVATGDPVQPRGPEGTCLGQTTEPCQGHIQGSGHHRGCLWRKLLEKEYFFLVSSAPVAPSENRSSEELGRESGSGNVFICGSFAEGHQSLPRHHITSCPNRLPRPSWK